MKKQSKPKKEIKIHPFFKSSDFVKALLYLVVIVVYFAVFRSKNPADSFDIKTFISFLSVFLIGLLTDLAIRLIKSMAEDRDKLHYSTDYLLKTYARVHPYETKQKVKLACADIISLYDKEIILGGEFDDPDRFYELPKGHPLGLGDVHEIHGSSTFYNNVDVRVDDVVVANGRVTFLTSRSTYFNALLTNRAMDYRKGKTSVTVRDIYEPGPFLTSLKNSQLSNHLGFNGYVETKDGKFIFIKRSKKVTIARDCIQGGVSAGLKTKYWLGEDRKVSVLGLLYAIQCEVVDELNFQGALSRKENPLKMEDIFEEQSVSETVLYFYRELVEGGKPQLVTYTKLKLTAAEVMALQPDAKALAKDQNSQMRADGQLRLFLTRDELEQVTTDGNHIVLKGESYPTVPTIAISHELFMDYLHRNDEK